MAISDRIEKAIGHMRERDYESALLHVCSAVDKTAQRKKPKERVGVRFKSFIKEYREFIYWGAMGWGIKFIFHGDGDVSIEKANQTLDKILYDRARNPIVHEAGLDGTLEIMNENGLKIGGDLIGLGRGFITGLIFAIVGDPVNMRERCTSNPVFHIGNIPFNINECWGKYSEIYSKVDQQAKNLLSNANKGNV